MSSLELAAARYRLGRASSKSLISLADVLLGEGHDEAVSLAIADDPDPVTWQVGPLFEELCAKLGQKIPEPDEAADLVTAAILREIVDDSIEPEGGLQLLMDDVYYSYVVDYEQGRGGYVGESHGLQHLIGAYWTYRELRGRPDEVSIDGQFGDQAIRLLNEQVQGYARDWLEAH